ncbi:ATP11-domain-containing protein [Tilletiaria anomala UBC 951]|uniref:ATP11-domain-containing protein n=1 Tax=Tilletiaria anomala (strain ATCC 24038 / CBS 436.72 / UBC 951) TaxID=1037660 RepID=A0A066WH87_TILAU|nr:ATP11-domain-containing protein [Tilletiaria anomala UBC 951]KDN53196.1 ATP11-domain-containing protein [Tilletiaria anomala UBC 951]
MAALFRPWLPRATLALAGPSRTPSSSATLLPVLSARRLHLTRPERAAVSGPSPDGLENSTSAAQASGSRETLAQNARSYNAPPSERQSAVQAAKERKMRQYEAVLKQKAAERGLKSIEELKAQVIAEKAAQKLSSKPAVSSSPIEERDAKVAADIRARAEAEAKRKLESGQLHPTSNCKGPVKPLDEILNIEKLMQEPPDRIQQLWTGYHMMRNKLSAVIPVSVYETLISTARRYPQFVLPLPRTIVGGEASQDPQHAGADANATQAQQGYEMHFLEWGFLPAPTSILSSSRTAASPSTLPGGDNAAPKPLPPPTTVLFTPLAEYKLRQEFAQPLLILTHYTDLAHAKGLVLMRGEITDADEAQAAGASVKDEERVAQPHSQGRMTQQDAQMLSICMQRFYLPDLGKRDANSGAYVGAAQRSQLLEAFHSSPQNFDVEKLVDAAFKF